MEVDESSNSVSSSDSPRKRIRVEEKLKRYEKIEFLGEGQFATVYKALDTETKQIVAVKKVVERKARDGINRTALREIKLLQEVHHKNIIGLLDVFGYKSNVSLVFDFMDTDLEDLKPNNLLVNSEGVLKIGDFGLARFYGSPNRPYSHQVVTRWYRAPELLFGARAYGTGVDMWAIGCILAEMLVRCPYFPGDSDLDQLTRIFTALGTPTDDDWPDMCKLPDFITFKQFDGSSLSDLFPAAGEDLIELLTSLLALNPLKSS
ncbi:Cyclin-dependent kinase 7 [Armadillidium nasatum]|uniref:Cyclin-dependent kinase 7 n=1 Tax=Armadillidium nasatum TaxID=96803 RepID=A0A5N5T054_9CRUS|nr:Cyclin-dependent kinase 7 [Armadillidium nasatum]